MEGLRLEDIEVRSATLEDYPAIVDISHQVYDGADYLVQQFHELYQNPNSNFYVGVYQGKVIGFINYFLVNDGEGVEAMAGRIAPSMRGRSTQILDHICQESLRRIQKQYPSVHYETWSSNAIPIYYNPPDDHKWKVKKWVNYIMSATDRAAVNAIKFDELTKKYPTDHVVEIGVDGMPAILDNTSNIQSLMPEGVFALYNKWIPLKPTRKNLMNAVRNCKTTVTYSNRKDNKIRALSFADANLGTQFAMFSLQFYGDSVDDLMAHTLYHIHSVGATMPPGVKNSLFAVCFSEAIDRETVAEALRPILGDEFRGKFFRRSQGVLVEFPLKDLNESKL